MNKFVERLLNVSRFNLKVYDEILADKSAFSTALGVVFLLGFAASIGEGAVDFVPLVRVTAVTIIALILSIYVTYVLGTKVFPEKEETPDWEKFLSAVSYACAPGMFYVLGLFPFLRQIVFLVVSVWLFVSVVAAVRHVMNYTSLGRALIVSLGGGLLYFMITVIL